MVWLESIVQLGAVEANAATWLDVLGIVISLSRGVYWTEVKIKTNMLEIAMEHGTWLFY